VKAKSPLNTTIVLLSLLISQTAALAQFYFPTTNGLIARWQADGNAIDSWGGHDGTLEGGMGFTSGKFGQAFAGNSNQRVFVPDNTAFQLTSFTIGVWINISENSWYVFFRGDNRVGLDPYALAMDNNGHVGIQIESATDSDNIYAPISLHEWHQVTTTLDGATHDLRLYIDGVLVGEKTTSVVPLLALNPMQTPGLGIGNTQAGGYDLPFLGAIDEVVLYDHALTSAELTTVVSSSLVPCTGPVTGGVWRNHNQFTAASVKAILAARKAGLITTQEGWRLFFEAARSSCGRVVRERRKSDF
jgi:hypothetical protein